MTRKSISASVIAQASTAAVWAVLTDLDSVTTVLPDVVSLERLSDDTGFSLGTRWRETRKIMGKESTEEMWVTQIQDRVGYVVEAQSRGIHYRSQYTIAAKGDGTEILLEFSGEHTEPSMFKTMTMNLMYMLMSGVTRKMLTKDLQAMAHAAEASDAG